MKSDEATRPIDPHVCIGHVHLKVADLERALGFYCGVLGFEITQRYGTQAAFVSAGGYHHHIGLNTWESRGGLPPPPGTTGLYHTAILYPTRRAFARSCPPCPPRTRRCGGCSAGRCSSWPSCCTSPSCVTCSTSRRSTPTTLRSA